MAARWTVLAPEYPPAVGGIADYVAQLARGLADSGDGVEVWAPGAAAPPRADSLTVHALERGFDSEAREAIEATLSGAEGRIVLLQYVPRMLGPAALAWLATLNGELWVMFHEVAYPFERGQALGLRALAAATHAAAFGLLRRADRVLVSTPGCERALSLVGGSKKRAFWLPIPSNLPTETSGRSRAEVLSGYGLDPERPVVGHFGTFGERVAGALERVLGRVLARDPAVQVLLAGEGSVRFAERFCRAHADREPRVRATGRVVPELAADALAAADVLVFPFPDGISSRRTSVMAALALGKAVVTSLGENTESVWRREQAVALGHDDDELSERVSVLLADSEARAQLGERAQRLYRERFSIEVVVAELRALSESSPGRVDASSGLR